MRSFKNGQRILNSYVSFIKTLPISYFKNKMEVSSKNISDNNGFNYSWFSYESILSSFYNNGRDEGILFAALLSPIICFGIVGYVLSILVWNKGKRRMTTTSKYMSALAVADILVLSISGIDTWLMQVLHIRLQDYSLELCRPLWYCYFVLRVISSWIFGIVTVERAIGVWMPHSVRLICRPNIAVFTIGPFCIIIVGNFSILINIIKSKRSLQARGNQTTDRGSQQILKTVTRRIIMLSLTFCFCNAPYGILRIYDIKSYMLWAVINDISIIPMYLNNGVNFLPYCMTGSGFRQDFMAICKCRSPT